MTRSLRNLTLASLAALFASMTAAPALAGDYGRDYYERRYDDGRDYRRGGYYRSEYRGDWDGYSYSRHRGFVVCDPDGDRCYRSRHPYWDYREYYRRHGYRWLDE